MTDWDALTAVWAGRRMRFVPAERMIELPTPRYVVVLISDGAGRYLLAHIRERGYCAPSGRIEAGETPRAAARREAYEESGAVLNELTQVGSYLLVPCSEREPSPCSAPVFLARAARIEPLHADSESQGVRWASLDELPAFYYDWSPLIEAVFRYAEERRQALWERQDEG
ncbi:MAG: NUDIX hydrolase [Fimbriimonadales bacterium]|nr:NUDIX hydrolase [Fimbriimonadales bacterium]